MDLMVLADALLLPEDDLALATVLKSPLFGLDDDELFELAWDRKGSAARRAARQRPDLAPHRLDALAQRRAELDAVRVLRRAARRGRRAAADPGAARPRGRRRARRISQSGARLRTRETPSLQGFIAWLRAAESEVKRDMEMARDEVRVMTVHGAKGLEAPIVILADTTTPPQGFHPPQAPRVCRAEQRCAGYAARLVWADRQGERRRPDGSVARDRARRSARRISTAPLRRDDARDRTAGRVRRRRQEQAAGRLLVRSRRRALEERLRTEQADDGAGEVLRYRKIAGCRGECHSIRPARPKPTIAIPGWLAPWRIPHRLATTPIKPSGFDRRSLERGSAGRPRRARGAPSCAATSCIALMQSLPDIPNGRAGRGGAPLLARQNTDFSGPNATRSWTASWRCSTIRALPRCSHRQPGRGADRRPYRSAAP